MFGNLQKTLEEGQKRWKQIEDVAEELKSADDSTRNKLNSDLLLLLIEHLRPMHAGQVSDVMSGLQDVFGLGKQ